MTEMPPALTNPETARFWQAAAARKLLLKRCDRCEGIHYYPRNICPHCFSPQTSWIEARGTGRIYSLTVMRRSEAPHVVAYVTLDEGVTMLTNIVGPDAVEACIGDAVEVDFVERAGRWLPVFRTEARPAGR